MTNTGKLWKLIQQEPEGEINFAQLHTGAVANMISAATGICLDDPEHSLVIASVPANEQLAFNRQRLSGIPHHFLLFQPGESDTDNALIMNNSEFLAPEQFLFLAAGRILWNRLHHNPADNCIQGVEKKNSRIRREAKTGAVYQSGKAATFPRPYT